MPDTELMPQAPLPERSPLMDSPEGSVSDPEFDRAPYSDNVDLLPDDPVTAPVPVPRPTSLIQRNQWIALAVISGACAAFNGVFAKLTTTELTTRIAQSVANVLHAGAFEKPVELVTRGTFFALNLVFNGVMWTLFTKALKVAHSSTQVSVLNTSTNFVLTALLGLAIFGEALPPLWWVGAAMLVAGNVIIGQKDESADAKEAEAEGDAAAPATPPAAASAVDNTHASTRASRSAARTAHTAGRGGEGIAGSSTSGNSLFSSANPTAHEKDDDKED